MSDAAPTVLLCGYGAFGALHAAAWRQARPGCRLLIADPSPKARRRAAGTVPEADIAADPEALLTEADIVDVVTPPDHHYAAVCMALAARKPVIVEKPAVRSLGHARDLAARARDAGCLVQVQFILRAHPLVRRAYDLLADGAIGRVLAVEGDFSGWKRMRADSSLIENDGVHFLDLMGHFLGGPPVAVDARATALLGGAESDTIDIDLVFPDDIAGRLRLGVVRAGAAPDPYVPGAVTTKRLTLIGERGTIGIDFNTGRLCLAGVRFVPSEGGWHPIPGARAWEQPPEMTPTLLLAETFSVFLNALDTDGPVLCDLPTGAVAMVETVDAIHSAFDRPKPPMFPIRRPA